MPRLTIALFFSLIAVNVYSIENAMQNCPKYHSNSLINKTLKSGTYLINSDQSSVTNKNIFQLNGNVEVTSKDYFFGADTMSLNSDKKEFYGEGNILFENDYIFLDGRNLLVENDTLSGTELKFNLKENGINGFAKKVISDSDINTFEKVNFSKCPIGSNDWSISASSLTVDEEKNIGVVDDLVFEFMGVPIFYSPYLDWPLEGRGSGFLAPSFSSYTDPTKNTSEQKINIPYYFNIEQDKDLLIDFDYLSSRGFSLGSLYRQLLPKNTLYESGRIELDNKILFSDKVSKKDRWLSKNDIAIDIDSNSKINIKTHRASDANYFNEIDQTSSEKNLISSFIYNYDNDSLAINLAFENEQVIADGTDSYLLSPSFNISKKIPYFDNSIDLSLSAAKIKNKNISLIQGNRFHLDNSISKEIDFTEFQLIPKISLLNTRYDLSNNSSINRSILKLKLDSKIALERNFLLKNTKLVQVFNPRFAYNYVENVSQSEIPKLDTGYLSLDSKSIFDSDKYSGIERIAGDNSIAYGLSTRIYSENLPENYIDLSIGQKYLIDNYSINLDGNYEKLKDLSNLYIDSSLVYGKNDLFMSVDYNPYENQTSKSAIHYSYLENSKKLLGFNFINDVDKTVGLNGSYPLNKNIHLFGSISKNINGPSNKGLFGIGYENCCWELRLVKFESNNNLSENSLNFELVFKGIASTTPNLKNRIKSQIPNYLKLYD